MKRHALPWLLLGAILALGAAALAAFREPLGRALFPDAALTGALVGADEALARGELDTAVRLLGNAEARDPDHPRVAEVRRAAGALALREVVAALDGADSDRAALGRAEQRLATAAALGAPGEAVQALAAVLAERRLHDTEADLQRAGAIEASDPEAALAIYAGVLARDATQPLARAGQRRIFGVWLDAAAEELARPSPSPAAVAAARALADRVRAADPAHLGLPDLQARLVAWAAVAVRSAPSIGLTDAERHEAARWRGIAEEALGQGAWTRAAEALARSRAIEPDAAEQQRLELRLAAAGG